jgi:RNA polymerase sigma factor (TIGR02999 family)
VHEAYIRLVDMEKAQHWNSRGHFFAAAAEAMRRILIESARHKRAMKHGGDLQRVALSDIDLVEHAAAQDWLELDDALSKLAREDITAANVAKLRIFAGLSVDEAAESLGISRATAFRHWTYGRAWLRAEMG